ncbi:MAG TPA: aldo/keto reductase [Firmicutes bacterium]|nr:aldo/keto reductase [Bacillota bacterium]
MTGTIRKGHVTDPLSSAQASRWSPWNHDISPNCHQGGRGLRRKHGPVPGEGEKACEESLARLGTDYIDLYQVHLDDPKAPVEDAEVPVLHCRM